MIDKFIVFFVFFFFFKQKTAYELRISDWSSDVCSSDLVAGTGRTGRHAGRHPVDLLQILVVDAVDAQRALLHHAVGMVVFPRSVGAGSGAQLAADAAVGVDEDDAVLLALVAAPGRTIGRAHV